MIQLRSPPRRRGLSADPRGVRDEEVAELHGDLTVPTVVPDAAKQLSLVSLDVLQAICEILNIYLMACHSAQPPQASPAEPIEDLQDWA